MKNLLREAREEILSLRRQNEILRAQVEVVELFKCALYSTPWGENRGAQVDVAWLLQKEIDELEKGDGGLR